MLTPTELAEINEKIGPPEKRTKEWQHNPEIVKLHGDLFDHYAELGYPYPENTFSSKGIVISAGGKYTHLGFVAINILREVGCRLPIELWYNGVVELTSLQVKEFEKLGSVVCKDAKKVSYKPRILNGWEMKPFSIIHSSFEEVLLIDADCIVGRDPTYLFHNEEYLKTGAIFWPDLPTGKVWIPDDSWEAARIPKNNRAKTAFESGQILINKAKSWKELWLTMHLNEYSDFWYEYVYGDKDTFKLAWHKASKEYTQPYRSKWKSPAIIQYDMDNKEVFYHCCQGKKQIREGKPIQCLPQPIRDKVSDFGKMYNKTDELGDSLKGRAEFENFCRARAVGIPMADNKTLTRVFGKSLLFCDSSNKSFTPNIARDGFWEAWISLFLLREVREDWTVLNIGANVGYYTFLLAPYVKRAIAVEPNPRCVELMKLSAHENQYGNVNVIQGALTDQEKVQYCIPNENDVCGNIFSYGNPVCEVKGYTLDQLIDLVGEYPDLIICDTEGAEHFIDEVDTRILFEVEYGREYKENWGLIQEELEHVDYDSLLKYITYQDILKDKTRSYMCWIDHTKEKERLPKEVKEWLGVKV